MEEESMIWMTRARVTGPTIYICIYLFIYTFLCACKYMCKSKKVMVPLFPSCFTFFPPLSRSCFVGTKRRKGSSLFYPVERHIHLYFLTYITISSSRNRYVVTRIVFYVYMIFLNWRWNGKGRSRYEWRTGKAAIAAVLRGGGTYHVFHLFFFFLVLSSLEKKERKKVVLLDYFYGGCLFFFLSLFF